MRREKNRFLRKILGIVLAITLALGSVPMILLAENDKAGNLENIGSSDIWEASGTDAKVKADNNYYYWEKADGTIGIMEYKGKDAKVTVPETIGGKKVTSLSGAFYGCTNITEISLPSGITEIGESSFQGCSNLKEISIPENVTEIGSHAFAGCSNITKINLPENVTGIENSAFAGCSSITKINLPENVTEIGNSAFAGCSNLTEISIPKNVERIYSHVFAGCNSLAKIEVAEENKNYTCSENVLYNKGKTELILCLESKTGKFEIPEGIEKIAVNAFDNCNRLTEIIIPASATEVTEGHLLHCNGLARIEVAEENPYYASLDGALYNKAKTELIMCPRGKTGKFEIPEDVVKIGDWSFFYCDNLTEISIPKSLEDIGFGSPFDYCASLQKIETAEANKNYMSLDGVLYDKTGTKLVTCPAGKTAKFEIPEGAAEIGYNAFSGCVNLTEISIPESVTEISDDMFSGCRGLKKIDIPKSVTKIGSNAFENCSSLVEISIPESVTEIGYGAFRQCSNLTKFNISKCTAKISYDTFNGCHNLLGIEAAEANENYASLDGVLYNKEKTELIVCPEGKIGKFEIPEGVEKIGHYGFEGCANLTEINIPESVVEIGWSAFSGCSGLKEINLPKGITQIEYRTFSGCSSLAEINIPESVTEIWDSAFQDCSNLRTIIIPKGVTKIMYATFSGCSNLTKISIPESITELGYLAFENCSNLTEISISANVVTIWDMVFKNCEKLAIKGEKDSCIENYAKNYSIPFICITTLSSSDGISVSYADDSANELILQSKLLTEKDTAYQKIDLSDKIADDNVSLENVVFQAYDITLVDKTQSPVQPKGSVTVKIPVPKEYQGENCKVYHVRNNGGMVNMDAVYSDNYLTFQTDHFSIYLITETELIEQNIIYGDINADGDVNSKDAVLLKKHLAGYEGLVFDSDAADLNVDGTVDSKDAVRLLRHLAGYEVILGE